MSKKVEVLICGSGSSGIFAGTWLSRYNIPCTILERRRGPLQIGQADGVQCRTVEIYESFGVSEELLRESYHVLEVAFWAPDGKGGIYRQSRTADTMPGLSHMPHVILNQARMNGLMLGAMDRFSGGRQGIEYGYEVKSIEVDETRVNDPNAYCVEVIAEKDGRKEVFQAKYVLGCDGAHSAVRKSLGFNMIGDTSDTVWGVMDIFPQTDFPDIRRKCTLHSPAGNLLIIPREGGSMVRFYIQLPPGSQPKDVHISDLQNTARKIFHPYTMEFAEIFWWSAYSIGQRLADHFHKDHRVFLTGDACHTHSPKAGQGMNVSLQDGYNIGWKLAMVLSVASDLINFDRELAKMFSARDANPEEFSKYFVKAGRYTAGLTARYDDSAITDLKGSRPELAKGIVVGMRFPTAQVIRYCDCKAMQLLRAVVSDGRWRVIIFPGDINEQRSAEKLSALANYLEQLAKGLTPSGHDIDSLIEPMVVLHSKFLETQLEQMPEYLRPITGKWKMRDLHKIYVDDAHYNSGHGHAYEKYEVDPARGAVVIVRPDQYVAKISAVDNFEAIGTFFAGFIIGEGGAGRESKN